MASDHTAQPCTHHLEPHVIYDKLGSGYRGMLRCRCHKVMRVSRKLRERHAEAEVDAQAMLTVKPRVRKPKPRAPRPPTEQEVTDMWRRYWRRVCAEHEHKSRL